MDNVAVLKKAYQDFAAGNVEAVLEVFHPEIEWLACTGFPFIKGDGRFVGRQAVVEGVFGQIPQHYENFHIAIQELFGCGDRVVMVGHYCGTWKATGKTFKANATHVWTVVNGKLTRYFQAADTAEIIN